MFCRVGYVAYLAKSMKYDYLIVGSGLWGSVFAKEKQKQGKRCLIVDKRSHIGGNCYTEKIEEINVHKYGAHIFNTNDEKIWNYLGQFVKFNNYVNTPKVVFKDKLFSFPVNMMTFNQLWGTKTPDEARKKIELCKICIENPSNLEEWILSQVGEEVYYTFIYGYTKKQWGREPRDLPISTMARVPIRFTYNENYYYSKFQGIPVGGYTQIFEKLLYGKDIELSTDYLENTERFSEMANKIVFTGEVDKFFGYEFGKLDYRSLKFENEIVNKKDIQGTAVLNYTDYEVPYTRSLEHKHFEFGEQDKTVLSKEYSFEHQKGDDPYYPINDEKNKEVYKKYQAKKEKYPNLIFGGRLAEYRYYSMDQTIASALRASAKL